MGSINLSQSIQEKQALARGKFFDRGFFINLSVLILIVGVYGGSVWYLGELKDELASLQASSAEKTATLNGPIVNRSVDIRERIDTAMRNQAVNPDPQAAFSDLERATLSAIQIREYRQIEEEQLIVVVGITDSFRYLAQQMLAFKNLESVASVHVEEVGYDKETKRIEFELSLQRRSLLADAPTEG
jgi:hypothetical protein